jgi:SAM-dependent methyltransferase
MSATSNPYDQVAYPTLIFRHCRPERLAAIARLHGLAPGPLATARTLEVGGGDGFNMTALAAAYPGATFVNIDLSADAIVRGAGWARAAGLDNVRHELLDLIEAPDKLEGQFNYIFAHGVYAWVPPPVRVGLMTLFGRLLAPDGIAYVSYNAMPGGHTRIALREMLLHAIGHIAEPDRRIAEARRLLNTFVEPQTGDEPVVVAMRREAQATLEQTDGQLFHDQLGPYYAPQSLSEVVAAAAAQGLRYLGDAGDGGQDQGFVAPAHAGIDDRALVRALQMHDYRHGRYFRKSLFVRQDRWVRRVPDVDAARLMWVTSDAVDVGDDRFRVGRIERAVRDPRIAAMIRSVIAQRPAFVPLSGLTDDPQIMTELCDLAVAGYFELHVAPPPFSITAGEWPEVSPLARMQLESGMRRLATLDHRWTAVESEALRRALSSMDGRTGRVELERRWAETPWATGLRFETAVAEAERRALLRA